MEAGYFPESGWIRSLNEKKPLDPKGNPWPWYTLGSIKFLEERLKKEHIVFEYGSGNSSLYLQKKVLELWSVENDKDWFEKISKKVDSNVHIDYCPLDESNDYPESIKNTQKKFDLVIVDGRKRNSCVIQAIESISDSGVIILDDSQREKYSEARESLKNSGFRGIDFWGMSPGDYALKCTSIFYRKDNCLNI